MTATIDRLSRAKQAESDYLKAILLHLTDPTLETHHAVEEQVVSYAAFAGVSPEKVRMLFTALEENDLSVWKMFNESIHSDLYGAHAEELRVVFSAAVEKRGLTI